VQVLKLGDALPGMELLLPRGGAAAFALEQGGGASELTGPVELVVDGGLIVEGIPEVLWTVDDSDTLPNGAPVTSTTPGAVTTTRVMFGMTADLTLSLAAGPHRGGIRYTAAGVGPVILARGLVVAQ
jgi:hypothetical protein